MKVKRVAAHLLPSIQKAALLPDQAGLRSLDVSAVLVEIETDEGITGVGESFYRSLDDNRFLAESVRAMARHLVGKDPLETSQRWQELYVQVKRSGAYGALSALDEALWDIKGKAAGMPIYQLLGGKTTDVHAYATYPLGTTAAEVADGAAWLAEHHFATMKIPVGRGVDRDCRLIEELVPRLPEGFGLAIDANTTYGFGDAMSVARVAGAHGLSWFEEPIEHLDILGMAELNRRSGVPIAGYQTYNTHYPALELLMANALDVYQPSLDYVGGVTAASRVGALVETFNKRLVPHTMGPIVNFTASLHVAAAQRACTLIEFPVLSRDLDDPGRVHTGTYVLNVDDISLREDGTVAPPDKPGIGVEIDWDMVRSLEEGALAAEA